MKLVVISFFIIAFYSAMPAQKATAMESFQYDIIENTDKDRRVATGTEREFMVDVEFTIHKKALKEMQRNNLPVFQQPKSKKLGSMLLLVTPGSKSLCEIFALADQIAQTAKKYYKKGQIEVTFDSAYIYDGKEYTYIVRSCKELP